MKVTITQEYLHRFIPKRCHKERAERKETTFSVTIREVDTKDAPVLHSSSANTAIFPLLFVW